MSDSMPEQPAANAQQEAFEPDLPEKPSTGRTLLAIGIAIAVVVLVFGWLLPSLGVNYEEVLEAIQTLTGGQMAFLLILGLVRIVIEGAALLPVVPGISLWQATVAWSSSTAVANVIPGPWDIPIRYSQYVGWGVSSHNALLSFPLGGIFTLIVKLSLPVIAVVLLLIDGKADDWVILLAVIGLVVMVVLIGVFVGIVRSVPFARKIGSWADRTAEWVAQKLNRDAPEDVEEKLLQFRADGIETLRSGWFWEALLTLTVFIMQYVILLVSLRFMDIGTEQIDWVEAFAVYAVVMLITTIPLTPGGVGVAEFFYIALFTQIAGDQYTDQITAAVFIFRIVTWLFVVPVGGLTYLWWRWDVRRRGRVPAASGQ